MADELFVQEHAPQVRDRDPAAGVLVLVTLYGGNDGLNTVVPVGDPRTTTAARPRLRPAEVLHTR